MLRKQHPFLLISKLSSVFLPTMKSKQEILQNYYSQGADGTPEISAEGLLKAMEEYRLQAEETAFTAARQLNSDLAYIDYSFPSFEAYQASLQVPEPIVSESDIEAANIQLIADSILEQFIPHDATVQTLQFNIRTNGIGYTVHYNKAEQGYWIFSGFHRSED